MVWPQTNVLQPFRHKIIASHVEIGHVGFSYIGPYQSPWNIRNLILVSALLKHSDLDKAAACAKT